MCQRFPTSWLISTFWSGAKTWLSLHDELTWNSYKLLIVIFFIFPLLWLRKGNWSHPTVVCFLNVIISVFPPPQELVWRSLLPLSRLCRWPDPYRLETLLLPLVSLGDWKRCVFVFYSFFFLKNLVTNFCFCFQPFQLQLQVKPWTSHHSRWPHTAFSCPTSSTHKRKDIIICWVNTAHL